MSLLEYLQEKLHCLYLSDLKFGNTNLMAKDLMKKVDYNKYTPFELSDAAEYLYGFSVKIKTTQDARRFLNSNEAKWQELNKAMNQTG